MGRISENKDVVSRAISDVMSDGQLDLVDELYAQDFTQYGAVSGDLKGSNAFRTWMEQVHAGFSDFEATEEFSLCEGDLVASRMTFSGTHDGEFLGIAATGTTVEITGITINRVEGGRIVESWVETDRASLLEQVGAMDSPAN
jgi:predicted ester cyclase